MENIFQSIGKIFVTIALAIAGIFGSSALAPDPQVPNGDSVVVGAAIPIPVAVFQASLQSSITSSATSMTLVTGTDKSGDALSGYMCFNIDEGTATEEFVCGTAAGTAVTSMIRGLDPVDGDLEVTALKKAHRRGASVKVTNYPSLGILSRILNGNETIPNAITYASGIGPTASSDLADKEYVLSVVSGGAISFEKVVISGDAGETVAAGNLVYLKASDGRWWKTDADSASTSENVKLGIAQGAGTAGAAISGGVLLSGTDANQSGLSANTVYYVSNTAGGVSSTAGTKERTVGIALSTTTMVFAPNYNQGITEDEQDALAGSTGTPSSSNKFVTEQGIVDASTTVAGDVEEATQAEVDAGTAAGALARLFTSPNTPSSYTVGPGPSTAVKTYFNMQMPFMLWTGVSAGAVDTAFVNWVRGSTETVVMPGGISMEHQGTGDEYLMAGGTDGIIRIDADGAMMFDNTNKLVLDFWARFATATATGDVHMGFGNDTNSFILGYNDTNERVDFTVRGSTGVLYATTSGGTQTATDISSGITLTNWNNYRIELDLGVNAKFYVNGVLKATHTTNLPTNAVPVAVGFGRSQTYIYAVTAPTLSIEMNP